jgi:hypothetical protein
MKDSFSTFDIVKILGINQNTLQSAIAGRYIEPDIQEPSKKEGRRARFSREGLYRVSLFFKLLQFGRSRREASLDASLDSNINWKSIGDDPDQFKYYIYSSGISSSPRIKSRGLKLYKQMPTNEMKDNEVAWLIINLAAVKNEIDRRIAK